MRHNSLVAGISNEDYHDSAGVSSSQLKYVVHAPAKYKAMIDGEIDFNQTPAMALGTAVHIMALEPDLVDEQIIQKPKFSGPGAVLERKEFNDEHEGKVILSADQLAAARAMAANIMKLPDFKRISADSQNEMSGWYDDPETGLLCRYRPDMRTEWCIADVKTCASAEKSAFSRQIYNLGYHISAAHYIAGDSVLMGTDHRQFIFICVESTAPHLAAVYVLDEEDLRFGEWQRARGLAKIKECQDKGEWPSYQGGIASSIGVPHWAKKEFLEEMK